MDHIPAWIPGQLLLIRITQGFRNPISHLETLLVGRLLFLRRRHHLVLELREYFFPELRVLPHLLRMLEAFQVHVGLWFEAVVAIQAVAFEKWADLTVKRGPR